jgi:carbonic anhydrase/acetyltransferase-like protein (isoleucine patch superfamily)
LHGLETTENGKNIDGSRYSASGEKLMANSSEFSKGFSVFVGSNTSLAHDSMVHGSAWIGNNNTFFGMKSIVFNAKDGNNVAIGISSITNGVPFMTTSHSNTSRCTTLKRRKPL